MLVLNIVMGLISFSSMCLIQKVNQIQSIRDANCKAVTWNPLYLKSCYKKTERCPNPMFMSKEIIERKPWSEGYISAYEMEKENQLTTSKNCNGKFL